MNHHDTSPAKPDALIEIPEAWRKEPAEEQARVVGREVVSRSAETGRYANGVVTIDKPAGELIEFPGFDTHTRQARGLNVGDTRERPTGLSTEDIEEA